MIAEKIKELIAKSAGVESEEVLLEHPEDLSHGDYASSIALVLAKERNANPKELAEKIAKNIKGNDYIDKITTAGPGFINVHLSQKFFADSLSEILTEQGKWGSNKGFSGKKVMVEYTQPNPFKEFHIGHLMGNTIGESVSRLIEFSGADVKRANYQGDVGPHVAKAIWGLQQLGADGSDVAVMGEAYAKGATAYKENKKVKEEIDALNKKIYERSDEKINKLYDAGKKTSLNHFEEIYKKLGTKFDYYFFESETGPLGVNLINKNKGVFEESDGAVVFRGENYDLHTRVFVTSEGLPTYEAKDLGLVELKKEKYPFDISITITAHEQREYFKVVMKALEQFDPNLASKIVHISYGMMRLPSGKMSSRTGEIITAETLLNEVEKKVKEKMKEGNSESSKAVGDIALEIAIGAVKYSVLKQSVDKDIIFDLERALSFEGDSGPYLQYTHARCASVLAKAEGIKITNVVVRPLRLEVITIERLLYRFEEVVKRASHSYEPHYVTTYLTELASAFNQWYAHEKILDGSSEETHKIALTKATKTTLQNGLSLLGIKAPEKM